MFVPWWVIVLVILAFLAALTRRAVHVTHDSEDIDARLDDIDSKLDSIMEHLGIEEEDDTDLTAYNGDSEKEDSNP